MRKCNVESHIQDNSVRNTSGAGLHRLNFQGQIVASKIICFHSLLASEHRTTILPLFVRPGNYFSCSLYNTCCGAPHSKRGWTAGVKRGEKLLTLPSNFVCLIATPTFYSGNRTPDTLECEDAHMPQPQHI